MAVQPTTPEVLQYRVSIFDKNSKTAAAQLSWLQKCATLFWLVLSVSKNFLIRQTPWEGFQDEKLLPKGRKDDGAAETDQVSVVGALGLPLTVFITFGAHILLKKQAWPTFQRPETVNTRFGEEEAEKCRTRPTK